MNYIDQNGLITPQAGAQDSGNGGYYSIIGTFLGLYDDQRFHGLFRLLGSNGMIWRTPQNTYGNNSHDDYLAWATYFLAKRNVWYPRSILFTTIMRLGYLKNCPFDFKTPKDIGLWKAIQHNLKQIVRPFIVIYPAWWVTMIASAFPNRAVFWSIRKLLTALILLQKLNLTDASGIQLRWLLCHAIRMLGTDKPMMSFLLKLRSKGTTLADVMSAYYSHGHPMVECFRYYEDSFLKQA